MDDVIKIFDNLIGQSSKGFGSIPVVGRWKYCVLLSNLGWEAYGYDVVPSTTDDEVIIKWRKDGREDIKLRLGFTDQRLWIDYLERKAKEKRDGK